MKACFKTGHVSTNGSKPPPQQQSFETGSECVLQGQIENLHFV